MDHIPDYHELELIQKIHTFCRNEFTIVRITKTMLVKSTIDASLPVRHVLKIYGIIDYDDLVDGIITYKTSHFLTDESILDLKTSYFRPKAKPKKPGDPRIWPGKLKSHLEALCNSDPVGLLLYVTVHNGHTVLIPLLPNVCSETQLTLMFGESTSDADTYSELLRKLAAISDEWIKSCAPLKRYDKDAGDTLELHLGLRLNNLATADYKGEIELKTKRHKSKTADTLFTKVQDKDISVIKTAAEMIMTYGYPSRKPKREGFTDLFVTVTTEPNPQGLFMRVNNDKQLVEQFYTADGTTEQPTCSWTFDALEKALLTKHPKTMWIKAHEKKIDGEIHFKYDTVEFTQRPIFSQFLLLIEQNKLQFDWRGGRSPDKRDHVDYGHAYRLKSPKDRPLLFGETSIIDLNKHKKMAS